MSGSTAVAPPAAPLAQLASSVWKWILSGGILAVIVGVLAIVWPGRTIVVVGVLFGVWLVWGGVSSVLVGLASPFDGLTRTMLVINGVLMVILGAMCFRSALQSVLLLGLWIGIGWIINAFTTLIAGISGWTGSRGWSIFAGIVGLFGGFTLITFPIASTVTLAVVTGSFLIAIGVLEIFRAFEVRKVAKA